LSCGVSLLCLHAYWYCNWVGGTYWLGVTEAALWTPHLSEAGRLGGALTPRQRLRAAVLAAHRRGRPAHQRGRPARHRVAGARWSGARGCGAFPQFVHSDNFNCSCAAGWEGEVWEMSGVFPLSLHPDLFRIMIDSHPLPELLRASVGCCQACGSQCLPGRRKCCVHMHAHLVLRIWGEVRCGLSALQSSSHALWPAAQHAITGHLLPR